MISPFLTKCTPKNAKPMPSRVEPLVSFSRINEVKITQRLNMKTTTMKKVARVTGLTLGVALLASTSYAQTFDSACDLNSRAIAASPRAREVFPWLERQNVSRSPSETKSSAAEIAKNRALAASPRTLEQFPELGRPMQPLRRAIETPVVSETVNNRAIAASPRALEQFPWLRFKGTEKTFEVAPIK
jgi:hypothetical protein